MIKCQKILKSCLASYYFRIRESIIRKSINVERKLKVTMRS